MLVVSGIEKYHGADMRYSFGMNILCQKYNTSACKTQFIEFKCSNCSKNCKYKCTLHLIIMADPRLTFSSCNPCFCDNINFVNVRSMQYTFWVKVISNKLDLKVDKYVVSNGMILSDYQTIMLEVLGCYHDATKPTE